MIHTIEKDSEKKLNQSHNFKVANVSPSNCEVRQTSRRVGEEIAAYKSSLSFSLLGSYGSWETRIL